MENDKWTPAKMTPDEVQGLLWFRKRAFRVKNKKGKGSYNRQKRKN